MTWSTSSGSDFIRDSDSSISTSSSIMSSSNTTTTYSYTYFNCSATRMLLQFRVVEVLHSQKIVVIVLWALSVCSQTWLVKWLIQNVLQLEVICQFSRHYKQCQCQIFMEYTCVYTNFFIIEWIVLNVMVYTMKNYWEVVKSLTVYVRIGSSVLINKPYVISCCANSRQLYLPFAHMCQSICNLQFASQ